MRSQADTLDRGWEGIRAYLEDRKRANFETLRDYPPQVAGCDTYYQQLSEDRASLLSELRKLDTLRGENPRGGIDRFIESCPYIDEAAARELRNYSCG